MKLIFGIIVVAVLFLGVGYYFGYDIGWERAVSPGGDQVADCRPTGCSNQICSDEDVVTTCEYREEYACYKNARCERQQSGECGWTPTDELNSCLANVLVNDVERMDGP